MVAAEVVMTKVPLPTLLPVSVVRVRLARFNWAEPAPVARVMLMVLPLLIWIAPTACTVLRLGAPLSWKVPPLMSRPWALPQRPLPPAPV